jgi:hypothetical protein
MRLVAIVKDRKSIERFLRGIGESTETPPLAPARAPPYFSAPGRARTPSAAVAPEPIEHEG